MDEPGLPPSAFGERSTRAIALVGFMGAGKTTVGRALADRLGWYFTDLDQLIEQRCGRAIPEIFRFEGESAFRDLEYSVLSEIIEGAGSPNLVLALGGGAFAAENVRARLLQANVPAVCLEAPVEELYRRCEQPGVVRPLRTNLPEFRQLYEQRRTSYGKADLCIGTGGKGIASVVEEIISGLKLVGGISE